MEKRRLQSTGGASLVVSLPKDWANERKLKAKDTVTILRQKDGSLSIVSGELDTDNQRNDVTIEILPKSGNRGTRELISHYLAGADTIRVVFKEHDSDMRSKIREAARNNMMGTEIIEETEKEIIVQCLPVLEFPLKKAMGRMASIASSMHKDSLTAIVSGNKALSQDVIQRDDDVDRFHHLIARQLNYAAQYPYLAEKMGVEKISLIPEYMSIAKSIERSADHAVLIAKAHLEMDDRIKASLVPGIREVGEKSCSIFECSMKALLSLDSNASHRELERASEMLKKEEKLAKSLYEGSPRTAVNLRLMLESMRRIAEYGSDIAEMTINMMAEKTNHL